MNVLWLAAGLVLFLFSHGRWAIPICAWFTFVFLIRFHRTCSRRWLATLTLWIGMSACHVFMYDKLLPVDGLSFYAVCVIMGAIWVFPFIVDGLICRRLKGSASVFLWPSLMVTMNYFLGSYLPSLAHAQIEYSSLVQIVSVTGMGGLVFLVFWFAAVLNRIWETEFNWVLGRRQGGAFLAALLVVLAFGETRLALASSPPESLQVAMINLRRNRLEDPDRFTPDIIEQLFVLSKKAADAGAKTIAWSEANADIPQTYEAELVQRGKAFAQENAVYLLMSFRSWETASLNRNKTIGISPEGGVVVDYLKSNVIPLMEARTVPGDGKVAVANMGSVKTGHVICYDMDFPAFIRQAGRDERDIVFAPSSDWRKIRFLHAASARFRAIENGFSLVRPTIQGISMATDPYGRILAYHDSYSTDANLAFSAVPSLGVRTVYATIGDLFSYSCIALLFGLILSSYQKGASRIEEQLG